MTFKNFFYFILCFITLCDLPVNLVAQNKKLIETEICNQIFNFDFQYTYQYPQGYLASTYGPIHNVGFGGLLKTKENWLYGVEASYQFGTEVNNNLSQNILLNLSNSTGTISNITGTPGMVLLGERGLNTFIKAGKLLNISKSSPNSGISIIIGVGFISHKISITTPENNIPTLTEDLKKGYDRLSMGIAFTQFVGYHFQGKNRMTNFYIGLDVIEGYTKNVRGFNYDTRQNDTGNHFDLFIGPKFSWMIPVYLTTRDQDEFIYR